MSEKLVSKQCVDFVKSFEGFSPTVYLDEVGVPTLGYGMTEDEIKGLLSVTEEQVSSMLEDWLNKKYASVLKIDLDNKGIALTQNQFDALTSSGLNRPLYFYFVFRIPQVLPNIINLRKFD